MNSPVINLLLSVIDIDKTLKTPVFLQLSQAILRAIQRSYLSIGTKLPGTRTMGQVLNIHRNTVVAAYEDLAAQGWIEILANKGAYVIEKQHRFIESKYKNNVFKIDTYPAKTGFNIPSNNFLDSPYEDSTLALYINDGQTDLREVDYKYLSAQYSSTMTFKSINKNLNLNPLKKQVCNYLNLTRGLHIGEKNILLTRSSDLNLYLIATALLKPNDRVLVAELSNFSANMIFLESGAEIETLLLDENGIIVEYLLKKLKLKNYKAIYLTPHHHYPTTVKLSAKRRIEILDIAQKYGLIIIEDDYDFELQYDRSSPLPLASSDTTGMVIYLGTFGKSLPTAFQRGFIIAPTNLIQLLEKYNNIIDRHGDIIMDKTLATLIDDGYIYRNTKKQIKTYRERRNVMSKLLIEKLFQYIDFDLPSGGLAFWLKFRIDISLSQLVIKCKAKGLFIPRHTLYQNKKLIAIRFGFGNFTTTEAEKVIIILEESIKELLSNKG